MPELPEVETIRLGLKTFILGHQLQTIKVLCQKSFLGPTDPLIGAKIIRLRRRGKALLVDLDNSLTLLIHLRMTGQLIFRSTGTEKGQAPLKASSTKTKSLSLKPLSDDNAFAGGHPTDSFYSPLPNTQTRVILKLDHGTLFFNDQRKFGFIKVLPTVEVEQDNFIASLAAEPWEIDFSDFYRILQRRTHSSIKSLLLDQKVIAGLGNIYADEALFFAGVHPARLAGTITELEAHRLLDGAIFSMEASIKSGGSTMKTYVRADGSKGNYLEQFAQVFRREGLPCRRCGHEIEKTRVAGRGTHFCPICQPLKGEL